MFTLKTNENIRTVTLDLNGGTSTQVLDEIYYENETITLEEPTLEDCTFAGWIITSGDGQLNENILTVGKENTTIKATWNGTWNFDYTGTEQSFITPVSGYYQIEAWGAQGGGSGGGIIGSSGSGSCYSPTGGSQTAIGTSGDSDCTDAGFGYGGIAPNGSSTSGI